MDKIIVYTLIIIIFINICIEDIRTQTIKNRYNIILFLLGIFLGFKEKNILDRILGSAVYALPFIMIYGYGSDIFNRETIGMGDVKLVLSLGMILKFETFYKILLFMNICYGSAFLYVILRYFFKKNLQKEIAFGPFLILASIILKLLEYKGG